MNYLIKDTMTPSILIIENDIVDRELTEDLIGEEGLDVRFASDVKSALMMLIKIRPVLILTSLTLPKIDGFTLTRILKNDADTCDIVVVALTDFKRDDYYEKIITTGFDGYISLPLDKRTFLEKVNFFLKNNTSI
jgi:CheY-like chemotaxis protein